MTNRLLTLLALTFTLLPAAAQEKVDLADLDAQVGDVTQTTINLESTSGTVTVFIGGEALGQGTAELKYWSVEKTEIVDIEDGRVTEYATTVTQSDRNHATIIFGEVEKESETSTILNEKVTWMLIDDQFVPELPNATEAQLEELEPETADIPSPYPAEPVAVGHKWELNKELVAQWLGEDVDKEGYEGSGSYELLEIVEHQGQRCAKLKMKLSFTMPMEEEADLEEGQTGDMSIAMEGLVYRSLDQRLDIDIDMKGKMALNIQGVTEDADDFKVKMEYVIKMTGGDKKLE